MYFTDLHFECSRLKRTSVDERVMELCVNLPPTSLCAIGGFPIKKIGDGFSWCNNTISPNTISSTLKEALGFSAILTYTNKTNKTIEELGQLCLDKGHLWALHWLNISIVFSCHKPQVELSFARDKEFFLSWPVETSPTGNIFVATAGIKEWLKYTAHYQDKSFDADTRVAMEQSLAIIKEIL